MARGTVVIEVDRCKGCELCTTICPQEVLHMSREGFNARGYRPVALLDPTGKCTGCALCALICPDVVLTVYRYDPETGTTGSWKLEAGAGVASASAARSFQLPVSSFKF